MKYYCEKTFFIPAVKPFLASFRKTSLKLLKLYYSIKVHLEHPFEMFRKGVSRNSSSHFPPASQGNSS